MPSNYSAKKGFKKDGSRNYKPDVNKYLYNIDTCYLNVSFLNYDDVMLDGLLDKLIDGRNSHFDGDTGSEIDVRLNGFSDSITFDILGGQPPAYQYSIRNDDIAIYFAKKVRENKQKPVKVQINQFILWEKGIGYAYQYALQVLTALGFGVDKVSLNRIDFAVHSDQFIWTLDDLKTMSYPKNIVDDNKPNFWRLDPMTGNFETVTYGNRTRLQLRIYDKSKEIQVKNKYYFYEIYKKHNMDVENIWNVEIEVGRDFIKECKDNNGVPLYDDFDLVLQENRLADLWSYIMDKAYNHKSAHWTTLKNGAINKGFYNVDGYELVRIKDNDSNFEREVAQIAGRLQLGVINKENYTLDDAIHEFKKVYKEIEVKKKKKDFVKQVEKKKRSNFDDYLKKTIKEKKNRYE